MDRQRFSSRQGFLDGQGFTGGQGITVRVHANRALEGAVWVACYAHPVCLHVATILLANFGSYLCLTTPASEDICIHA